MHCVSSYPCLDEQADLSRINKIKSISKNIGLSDHTNDILSSVVSLGLGVNLIEKHFTIDNNLPGRDNKFAILPKQLLELSRIIERYKKFNIVSKEKFIPQEIEIRKIYSGRWSKQN